MPEKGNFPELFVILKFMNHGLKGNHLTINNHSVPADCDKVLAFLMLITHFKLINAANFHVKEFIGMGFLQQSDNFWNCKDLILD